MNRIVVATSCYSNIKRGNTVSITGDGGNAWGYYGAAYKKLAPSWKLYTTYIKNPDYLDDDDLIEYYITEYYNHRLKNVSALEILTLLKERFGDDIILLCHEKPGVFCHRRVVADFLELEMGITIPEIGHDSNLNMIYYDQPDYKPILKKIIK